MIDTLVERDGAWLRVGLAMPPGNILTLAMMRALRDALRVARQRRALKWLTIEGTGNDFSFGASIQEHLPSTMPALLREMHGLLRDLLAFPAPTAALVRGCCLGGGFELALACDDIVAESSATIGFPEISLGAFPPGGAALLPPRVGTSRAARAMLTGEARSAQYWHEAGLLSLVAEPCSIIDAARSWFDRHLGPRSAVALAHAAEAARLTLRAQAEPALDLAERQYLERLLTTRDALEGVQAWLEKRSPQWKDM